MIKDVSTLEILTQQIQVQREEMELTTKNSRRQERGNNNSIEDSRKANKRIIKTAGDSSCDLRTIEISVTICKILLMIAKIESDDSNIGDAFNNYQKYWKNIISSI